jgi:hypothetical protein
MIVNTRDKCILCDGIINCELQFKLPSFMGVKNNPTNINDFNILLTKCEKCGEVSIKDLLDLNTIYQNNHNINIVGDIWRNHYIQFSNFIQPDLNNKNILEISDPSAKIAKLSSNFKSWEIIEPNPENIKVENVKFTKGFFDNNFATEKKDIIIHSHLLEHIYDPLSFFDKCSKILNDDGLMIFSIPDMQFLLDSGFSPSNILHFEHTYFINKSVVEYFASKSGFEIIDYIHYKNHSIFFKLKKTNKITTYNLNLSIIDTFKKNFKYHISNIKAINNFLDNNNLEFYLFGAHVSSQFYISNGLNISKIINIIDNDPSKNNKYLFGTSLQVKNSEFLIDKKCAIICSHTGIYFDEIVSKLLSLNSKIIVI